MTLKDHQCGVSFMFKLAGAPRQKRAQFEQKETYRTFWRVCKHFSVETMRGRGPELFLKTSITFNVCLGMKRAECFFGGYKKKITEKK